MDGILKSLSTFSKFIQLDWFAFSCKRWITDKILHNISGDLLETRGNTHNCTSVDRILVHFHDTEDGALWNLDCSNNKLLIFTQKFPCNCSTSCPNTLITQTNQTFLQIQKGEEDKYAVKEQEDLLTSIGDYQYEDKPHCCNLIPTMPFEEKWRNIIVSESRSHSMLNWGLIIC